MNVISQIFKSLCRTPKYSTNNKNLDIDMFIIFTIPLQLSGQVEVAKVVHSTVLDGVGGHGADQRDRPVLAGGAREQERPKGRPMGRDASAELEGAVRGDVRRVQGVRLKVELCNGVEIFFSLIVSRVCCGRIIYYNISKKPFK